MLALFIPSNSKLQTPNSKPHIHHIQYIHSKATDRMHKPQTESFVIQVSTGGEAPDHIKTTTPSPKFNLSPMKLFSRFRRILMRLIFSVPSSAAASSRHTTSDRFDPPKTSCSSYYSSYSHYNEAIADCIDFFNKSAQDPFLDARNSHVV